MGFNDRCLLVRGKTVRIVSHALYCDACEHFVIEDGVAYCKLFKAILEETKPVEQISGNKPYSKRYYRDEFCLECNRRAKNLVVKEDKNPVTEETVPTVIFENNLKEFAAQLSFIIPLETSGKISAEDAYKRIKALYKKLKGTKKSLIPKDK